MKGSVLCLFFLWVGFGVSFAEWIEQPTPGEFYVVVDKAKNELTIRHFQDGRVQGRFRAITGKNQGDKEKEGDLKTPEGIYFVEKRVPQRRLQPLHGVAGYVLNYPNPVDQIHKRGGFGIWIHGVESDDRINTPYDTQGCVALRNSDVLEVGERLRPMITPVVIVADEDSNGAITGESVDSALGQRIRQWLDAWMSKDAERYLAFYSPNFVGRNMNFQQWRAYKTRLTRQYQWIKVEISDVKLLRHGKYSVATFLQKYESDKFRSFNYKRLYLEGAPEQALIIAEESLNNPERFFASEH